ncbi:putative signal-recognition particle receptor FtsY [Helianthus anomalus]
MIYMIGKLKPGTEIKASDALKKSVLDILTTKGAKTELKLGFRKPAVIMIVGVNGGGKTTSLDMFNDHGFYIASFYFVNILLSPVRFETTDFWCFNGRETALSVEE